jgi:signal transduction histidine kinase/CheY-like chemotaxis protein
MAVWADRSLGTKGAVVVVIPLLALAGALAVSSTGPTLAVAVIGTAGAFSAQVLFTRSVDRRLALLRDNARRLAAGEDLVELAEGRDEIGQLGDAMDDASALLRRREAAVQAAMAGAETANRAKTEFLSRMSHELRTPLNAMLGFAQILEMEPLTPEQLADVGYILRGGQHLLGLINEVLDISRIESGDLALSVEPVAPGEVVAEVLHLLGPLADREGVVLSADPSVGAPALVRADRQRLNQILLNLVANAIKYNRQGGMVTVAVTLPEAGVVRLTVTDTGPGISRENLDLLFAPFARLGAERSTVEGTGIGLAVSRRLAEAMGGTVAVETRVGHGSTFWIELPAVPGGGADAAGAVTAGEAVADLARSGPPSPGGPVPEEDRALVLCIDDNAAHLEVVEAVLGHLPWVDMMAAPQARLGVDLARDHRPRLILLDLHLPDLDGEEVLGLLRAHPETAFIPVVVVSADSTRGAVRRLLAHGAVACLTKPVDVPELLACVSRYAPEPSDRPRERAR